MALKVAGLGTYTLAGSISSTQTSITLSSFTVPITGTDVTMASMGTSIAYGTISPGTANSEFISFTGVTQNSDGTATLTGVTRGLDKQSPYTTSSSFKRPHSGQAQFILSDSPNLWDSLAIKQNDETISGVYTFTAQPVSTAGLPTAGTDLATKQYVDNTATGTTNVNRIIVAGTAGETITKDQVVYLKASDGRWWLADADVASTDENVILGIAQGGGTAGNAISSGVLTQGLATLTAISLTANTKYYVSNTAGAFSSTPGTTEVTLGISQTTTTFVFYPRYDQQLTEDQQDALVGTSGTPSATNKYVTDSDSRLIYVQPYGDGSDGAGTMDGSTTVAGMAPSGNVYTATRDYYFTNLTINTGVTFNPNGYRIFGNGTLTGTGTAKIARNGNNGGNAGNGATTAGGTGGGGGGSGGSGSTGGVIMVAFKNIVSPSTDFIQAKGGTGGTGGNGGNGTSGAGASAAGSGGSAGAAGAALAAGSIAGGTAGVAGSAGGKGQGTDGSGTAGTAGTAGTSVTNGAGSSGVAGGAGGAGGGGIPNAGGAAGAAGTVTNPLMLPRNFVTAIQMHTMSDSTLGYIKGSAGSGGGGGGGGGYTPDFTNCGGGGGGRGGSGGTGGLIVLVYNTYTGTALTAASATAGGSGGAGGTAGTSSGSAAAAVAGGTGSTGANGLIYLITV